MILTTDAFLSSLWRASWQGALAFLCVWIVCRVFGKRLLPDTQCWLWRLSYVKLLVGLLWGGVILLPLLSPTPISPPRFAASPPIVSYHDYKAAVSVRTAANISAAPMIAPVPVAKPVFPWRIFLVIAYLIGVLVCLGRLLLAAHRTRQILCATGISATEEENLCLTQLAQRMRMPRIPILAHSASVDSPVYIAGLILLPQDIHYSDANLRMILAHELAHARRRDLHWEWLGTLVQILFFFHPLVMLARREERLARESAADALALQATQIPAVEYGKLLLSLVLEQPRKRQTLTGAVGVIEGGSLLRRRLLALREASHRRSRRTQGRIALILTPLILLIFVPWKMIHAQAQLPKIPTGDKSFNGVVSDETGKPISGITVNLISVWPQNSNLKNDMKGTTRVGPHWISSSRSVVSSRLNATTDAHGHFAFSQLPAGHFDYILGSLTNQYVTVRAALVIAKTDGQKDVHIALSHGSLVTGRVVDGETRQPLAGIYVNAGVIPSGGYRAKPEFWELPYDGITDAEGRYQIRVPPGNIGIGVGRAFNTTLFSQRVRYAFKKVSVQPGRTASFPDLPVLLHPIIVFVGPDGKPLVNTMVRLTAAVNKKRIYIWGFTLGNETDITGTILLDRFESGAFSIVKNGRSAAGTFQWSPHQPLVIVINGHSTSYPDGIGTVQVTQPETVSALGTPSRVDHRHIIPYQEAPARRLHFAQILAKMKEKSKH